MSSCEFSEIFKNAIFYRTPPVAAINNVKTKVDGIDLTEYVKKSDYDTKVGNLELKIPDVSGKLNTSDFNSKVSELENKIRSAEQKPNISNLATKSSVTAVKNKIPNVKGFVKKKLIFLLKQLV